MNEGYVYQEQWRYTRRARTYDIDNKPSEDRECRKYSVTPSDRSPGLLTCTCPHSYVEGFEVLRSRECTRHLLDSHYTRLDRGTIISLVFLILHEMCPVTRNFWSRISYLPYDNACNLDKLITAREPGLFLDTVFCIDPWHKEGHKCGDMYNAGVL